MKTYRKLSIVSTLTVGLVAAVTLSASVSAQELTGTLKKIKESGTITLGVRETSTPFSYLDEKQQPIGYSIDLCMAIVEEVKKQLMLPSLNVKTNPVTSQTRIPLMANGTIDLECGSTTNTLTRQQQVDYAPTTFVTGTKLVVKKTSKIKSYKDLKGKTVVLTQGTTNERVMKALNDKENLGMKFLSAKDHGESFLTVESGRAVAFAMDDVLLYGLVAKSKKPSDYMVVGDYLSYDPYAVMHRRNDADFALLVKKTMSALFRSGEINKIYDKWFVGKLPDGTSIGMPMAPLLKAGFQLQALPE